MAQSQRHALARLFLQRGAIGGDRLFQPRGAALALAEGLKRSAEIVLGRGPVERHALARPFLQGGAIGVDRLLQPGRAALALAEGLKRIAEIVLGHGPVERHALARSFLQARRDRPRPPAAAAPCRSRARRGLQAHCRDCSGSWPSASGTRSRVYSSKAARIGLDRLLQPCRCRSRARRGFGAQCRDCSGSWPNRAVRARAFVRARRRDRPRPPAAAARCRSRARRGWQAQRRDCSGSWPNRVVRARACTRARQRDRPRPPGREPRSIRIALQSLLKRVRS